MDACFRKTPFIDIWPESVKLFLPRSGRLQIPNKGSKPKLQNGGPAISRCRFWILAIDLSLRFVIWDFRKDSSLAFHRGVGRVRGVGRDLGVALGMGVGLTLGDGVAVGVGVALGVGVGLGMPPGVTKA